MVNHSLQLHTQNSQDFQCKWPMFKCIDNSGSKAIDLTWVAAGPRLQCLLVDMNENIIKILLNNTDISSTFVQQGYQNARYTSVLFLFFAFFFLSSLDIGTTDSFLQLFAGIDEIQRGQLNKRGKSCYRRAPS